MFEDRISSITGNTETSQRYPTVEDIVTIEGKGPWDTKSGGKLNVLFGISLELLQEKFFKYNTAELEAIATDIRGLRSYIVTGLVKGAVGANEWHKLRSELVFAAKGRVRWSCEDVYGNKKEVVLENGVGAWTPPFVLHEYEALSDASEVQVICNTLFIPEDPTTHDTHSAEVFRELQTQISTVNNSV